MHTMVRPLPGRKKYKSSRTSQVLYIPKEEKATECRLTYTYLAFTYSGFGITTLLATVAKS